ncbi:hypothetical protein ABCS02_04820 [Microbacterium sp. X-17]|uniref:hypothetical protein n=1 Tax=Microbacterium sp. X-17 TaxID=3144404 RepID=UPI0031F5CAB3
MANQFEVMFEVLAGPDEALALNGGHFIGVGSRERAEEIAARLRTPEGAAEKVAELREQEDYSGYADLRIGAVTVHGPEA